VKAVKRTYLQILLILLTITLMFPSEAWAQVTPLQEVRFLLRNYYVEPVKEDILNSPTIDAMLAKLDDPYTSFWTSQQYEDFNNYLEQSYTGIGIYLEISDDGVIVTGLVSGSPSEKAGLQVGDIITSLDSRSLKGLSPEEVAPLIIGPEGSWVQLTCQRAGTSFTVQVERVNIVIPSVTGEIKSFNTGYLEISSFASETSKLFAASLVNLRHQNPNSYIIDLRDNGGGYVQSALNIAGYFIGDKLAVQVNYRDSSPYFERAVKHSYIVDKPTIFLINHDSASASEILALAVRDHKKAVLIGTQSFGKGCGQQIFPLVDGGYLKMTNAYFRSPLNNSINKKGITPDLLIEKEDPLKVSLLLLSANDTESNNNGLIKLSLGSKSFVIDTEQARKPEYWQAYGEILDKAGRGMMKGKSGFWESVTAQELTDRRSLYYPDYRLDKQVPEITVDNNLTIHFPQNINLKTINQENIELIANNSGERVPLVLEQLSAAELQAVPQKNLVPGTSYWLLLHPGIQYTDNTSLQSGVVFTTTVNP